MNNLFMTLNRVNDKERKEKLNIHAKTATTNIQTTEKAKHFGVKCCPLEVIFVHPLYYVWSFFY